MVICQFTNVNNAEKVLCNWPLGPMLLKILRPSFINFRNKLVFVLCKLFKPSVIFVGKARAHPRVEHLKVTCKLFEQSLMFVGRLWPCPQTLD